MIQYPPPEFANGQPISSLLAGRDASLWLGRRGGGVQHLVNGRFDSLRQPAEMRSNSITGLCEDSAGRVWVGTESDRLYVHLGEDWRPVSEGVIPSGENIRALVADQAGNVVVIGLHGSFVATPAAIDSLVNRNNPLKLLPVADKFKLTVPAGDEGWPQALLRADRRLWTATMGGLASVDLNLAELSSPPPRVVIEQLKVDNSNIAAPAKDVSANQGRIVPQRKLSLGYGFKQLEFVYDGPSLGDANDVQFFCRLIGYDDYWTPMGIGRSCRYARLPPGTYEFQVTDSYREGPRNQNVSVFAFQVLPPYWMRWWFIAGLFLLAAGSLIWTVRVISHRRLTRRLALAEQRQATEKERTRIAQDMHDEVGSKLTRIRILSSLAQNPGLELSRRLQQLKAIGDTSEEAVRKFDEIVWTVNPRNDTLQHLADYLAHYAVEYFDGTQIQCELKIAPLVSDSTLSAEVRHNFFLAYKEALCNVLHHSQAAKVCVNIVAGPSGLEVGIADDGIGFEPALQAGKKGADGLINMRKRLANVGGRFTLQSAPGHGTQVWLQLETAPKPARSKTARKYE